jgi:hypothetical protein
MKEKLQLTIAYDDFDEDGWMDGWLRVSSKYRER